MTNRAKAIKSLRDISKSFAGSKYTVRRGVVAWDRWDFTRWPFGLSISLPDETYPDSTSPVTSAIVTLTMLTRVEGDIADFDDDVLEVMRNDFFDMITELSRSKDENGEHLLLDVTPIATREMGDATRSLQGITGTFSMEY